MEGHEDLPWDEEIGEGKTGPKDAEPNPSQDLGVSAESPEKREQEPFPTATKVVVKGSTAFALSMGKDMHLARDVDIFVVENSLEQPTLQKFQDLKHLQATLPPAEAAIIAQFIEKQQIGDLPIHIVRTNEDFINETRLFNDEPEVVLWDAWLEMNKKVLKPLNPDERTRVFEDINKMRDEGKYRYGYFQIENLRNQATLAHDLHRYQQGDLVRGHMPEYLEPENESLSTNLRLLDLGRRFDIPYDDFILRWAEQHAESGELAIAIPPEQAQPSELIRPVTTHHESVTESFDSFADETDDDESLEPQYEDDYFGTPRSLPRQPSTGEVLDIAFYNVATRKDLLPVLLEEYPRLGALVTAIQDAGGIREYVATNYGTGYLHRESLQLKEYKFTTSDLTAEEQVRALTFWATARPSFSGLFNSSFESFVEEYTRARKNELLGDDRSVSIEQIILKSLTTTLAESENPSDRLRAYEALGYVARDAQIGYRSSADLYAEAKQLLKEHLEKEQHKNLRKTLVQELVSLANRGTDLTIATDFANIVRVESAEAKKRRAEKKEILSPEGMLALRGLLKLGDEDAHRAVAELVANPAIDPRLKKLCLSNLVRNKRLFHHTYSPGFEQLVDADLRLPPRSIPWGDYEELMRIQRISSTTVRTRIERRTNHTFQSIRGHHHRTITEVHQETAPDLPSEFFLPLYDVFNANPAQLKKWERFMGGIKSTKMRESLLFSMSNCLDYPPDLVTLITDRIIDGPEVTKEHIAIADRLLKKVHSLVIFQSSARHRPEEPNTAERPTLQQLLTEMKSPSLLEIKLDEMIVTNLFEITGRGDLSSDRIQKIFNAWEDPEPMFIFTSMLALNRGSDRGKLSLDLMGEMLAHMDPPRFEEWKQWRYDQSDELTRRQLEGMSQEQIDAYAEDEFVDLGEVLVGLLPSDKPRRIQEELLHALRHDWREAGDVVFIPNAKRLSETAIEGGALDFAAASAVDLESISSRLALVERRFGLEDDIRTLQRLPEYVRNWQRKEAEKRTRLTQLGFGIDAGRAEIENRIQSLQQKGANDKLVNELATIKPSPLPEKTRAFLERYNLPGSVDTAQLEQLGIRLQADLATLTSSAQFVEMVSDLFGSEEPTPALWQRGVKRLKATQTLLQLGNLTPQLIAFNRITAGKKKVTLQSSIDGLKRNFQDNGPLMATLGRIEEIIAEASHPVGKDRLAIIFTDNPMAMLTTGKFPHGATSCKNYENGDSVLAANMADATTKICMLIDISKLSSEIQQELETADTTETKLQVFREHTLAFLHASVGRRLTKLVQEEGTNDRQVFLEPVYTPLDRTSMTRLLNAFAVTTLQPKLGLQLVKGGNQHNVVVPESHNHYQYEDGEYGGPGGGGAGIGVQGGRYSMPARQLEEADYLVGGVEA